MPISCSIPDVSRAKSPGPRVALSTLLQIACCLLLVGCSFPGSVPTTVKIGLSAPFEGLHRDTGYQVLHAVRLAVRQRNDAGGVGDRYLVELVALNDFDEPGQALVQARKMAVDDGVLGVIGGWSPQTADLAAEEYQRLGLVYLSPPGGLSFLPTPAQADPTFVERYRGLSGGPEPDPVAFWAYEAAMRLLDAFDAAAREERQLTRTGVEAALGQGDVD